MICFITSPAPMQAPGIFYPTKTHLLPTFAHHPQKTRSPSTFFPPNTSNMANANSNGWTDELLIREIRAGADRRKRAWHYIHTTWFGAFLGAVRKDDGKADEDDVYAVLGQVYRDVEKQVCKPDFELYSATLRTYIAGAVVRAWKRWMGKNSPPHTVEYDPQVHQTGQGNSAEQDYIAHETLDRLLAELGEPCRTILLMDAQGYRTREIGQATNLAEQTVKNKKTDCLKNLIDLAKNM